MLSAFKKFLLGFFLFVICYFPLAATTYAQIQPTNTGPYQMNTDPDVPQNMHTYTQSAFIEVISAATCVLTGKDPANPSGKCLGFDPKTQKLGYVEDSRGALGMMGGLISMTFDIPVHTGSYFNYMAQNFGVAKSTYAAGPGIGFVGLAPLMGLWLAFRNIVYLLFTVIFLIIGMSIMLRVKIDPRTVMTIENQIPKVIIGLLLVTFSFAIAGFIVDLMYVSTYLFTNIVVQADSKLSKDVNGLHQITNTTDPFQAANIIGGANGGVGGFFALVGPAANAGGQFIAPIGNTLPGRTVMGSLGAALGYLLGPPIIDKGMAIMGLVTFDPVQTAAGVVMNAVNKITGGVIDDITGPISAAAIGTLFFAGAPVILDWVGWAIVGLILSIALIWALFRLWFQLLQAYIFLLLDVVFAPFWIVAGMFPGSPVGFGAWLRDMFAYVSAFPVTIALFLIGRVLMDSFGTTQTNGYFVPPMIANPSTPNGIGSLIGLGIILMAPQALNITRDAFKAPQFKYTAAIFQAVGVGPSVAGQTWNAFTSPYGFVHGLTNLQGNLANLKGMGKSVAQRFGGRPDVKPPKTVESQ